MSTKKIPRWLSALLMKCPACREANLFENRNPYIFSKLLKMPKRCHNCDQDFEIENGFYWGAMMISYLFGSILLFALVLIGYFVLGLSVSRTLIYSIIIHFLYTPWLFRLSRSVWIHLFVPLGGGVRELFDDF